MTTVVRPVILSGGAGTRLWPLSTRARPKQFVDLVEGTLFDRTVHRLDGLRGLEAPIVVAGVDHLDMVKDSLARISAGTSLLIAEPVGRNTAPAVLSAALLAAPSDVLVVLPSDHLIEDEDGFRKAVETAVPLAQSGRMVTFGVKPRRPETGFGYIETGEDLGECLRLSRFMEKPSLEVAQRIWNDGKHLWNSGMFVFQARTVIAEAKEHRPDLVEAVTQTLPSETGPMMRLASEFADVDSISIDSAVMEKTSAGVVIPIDVGWTDVGSYQALLGVSPTDEAGNAVSGDVTLLNVTNSYVRGRDKRIVVAGLEGLVIVETEAAILVVPVKHSQAVRDLVGLLDDSLR